MEERSQGKMRGREPKSKQSGQRKPALVKEGERRENCFGRIAARPCCGKGPVRFRERNQTQPCREIRDIYSLD